MYLNKDQYFSSLESYTMESFKNTHLFDYPSEKDKKKTHSGLHKQNKKHVFAINKFND